jgi:hypothetical protein
MLTDRDYTLILDKSGSMQTSDRPGGPSRWARARESTLALAPKCHGLDADGLTVYVFASRFRRYERVTPAKVDQIFRESEPAGGTDLAGVLRHAFGQYFARKARGEAKPGGETFVVVTDGEPDDRRDVVRAIVEAPRKVARDDEIGVSLVQVGDAPLAARFLRTLDDELDRAGAPFDLCDALAIDDLEDLTLTEALLRALHD